MVAISDEATDTLVPFELDQITKEYISPEKLPYYSGPSSLAEIDQAYELLDKSQTSEEFYKAIAILVFHARHLRPVEHANLARLIFHPFSRRAGKPSSIELRAAVRDFILSRSLNLFKQSSKYSSPEEERKMVTAELAQRFKTSKKFVSIIIREMDAEFRAQAENKSK